MPLGTASVSAQEYTLRPRRLAINKAKATRKLIAARAVKGSYRIAAQPSFLSGKAHTLPCSCI